MTKTSKFRECPVCHDKFIPTSEDQISCSNEHCKTVVNAKKIRDKLYKKRMKELGKDLEDYELIGG